MKSRSKSIRPSVPIPKTIYSGSGTQKLPQNYQSLLDTIGQQNKSIIESSVQNFLMGKFPKFLDGQVCMLPDNTPTWVSKTSSNQSIIDLSEAMQKYEVWCLTNDIDLTQPE
jgi:hypothetical protein